MKNRSIVVILLVILVAVYWQWWLPYPKVANDFPIISDSLLKSSLDFPRSWSENGAEGLGEYYSFFLWSWPISFISGLLANIGLSFVILERTLLLIPFLLLGSFGIWKLCQSLNLTSSAKFISTLFYLTNSYILLVIDGGQLSIGLTYALFPLAFLAVEKSINGTIFNFFLAGLIVSILGYFDIRFILLLFLLTTVKFFYQFFLTERKKSHFLNWIASGVIIGLVVIAMHAYWLLPLLKVPISSKTYNFFTQAHFLTFMNLGHSLLLLAPHWFKNIFGSITTLRPEFIFIPILVFLAPILRPKNTQVGFWLLISVLAIFLTKGSAEPFTEIYPWLFSELPLFSLFRDSTKFFFLVSLSFSLLIGVTIDEIIKKIKSFPRFRLAFLWTVVIYLLFIIRPVWLNQMTGTFSKTLFEKEYQNLSQFLSADKDFGRVFWTPSFPPLGYAELTHPRVEASRLVSRRPFAVGVKGTYETFNFLREAPYMGEIFDIAGIGYIAYPYLNPKRDNLHPDNIRYYYTFLNQLSTRPWLSKVENSQIPLFKVNKYQDRFFITPNIWWVIGSDNIYNESTKSANLKLSKNALIFAEEYPKLGNRIDELPQANIVLNNKTPVDLAASFIKNESLIFPARQLTFHPDKTSGWWKREAADLINWRDFLQIKYGIDNQDFDLGGGWAVGEGKKQYQISNIKYQNGNILLARVMESSRSGSLKFYQDDQLVGEVRTKVQGETNVRWFEVGELRKDVGEIEIASLGDINVVNALAVLDKNEWASYQDKAKNLQRRIVSFDEKNAQNDSIPTVTYQKINPTKYIVNVSNLTQSAFLVFSQNYDQLWKKDDQTPLPVYSLLNGFKIEKDGQYVVEFEAQKYVLPGLIISGVTVIVLVFWYFNNFRRYNRFTSFISSRYRQ